MNKDPANGTEQAAPVTEQASAWWIALNAGTATPEDHRAFCEWAARSPERIEAFLETARLTKVLKSTHLRWPDTPVETLARQAHDAGAGVFHLHDAATSSRTVPADVKRQESFKRSFSRPVLALAATIVLAIASGLWILLSQGHRYQTAVGEQRSVALDDGSVVTLNTATLIDVEFRNDRRLIRLLKGEALFQVARDPSRPFDVIADTATVRAVGTQFNIELKPRNTVITVVEGKVALSRQAQTTYLSAGEQISVEPAIVKVAEVVRPADPTAATAWTQRRLVFDHRPIGEVAEEFNRYNRTQIEISGAGLRAEQMTGVFKANDPQSFLDFVSRLPGVAIRRDEDRIVVSAAD